jgi:hypothetical protein
MPVLSPQVRYEGVNGPSSVAVRGPSLTQSGHQPQRQHRALVSRPPIQFRGRTCGPCSSLIVPAIATSCRTLLTRKCGTGKTGQRFLLSPIAHHRHYGRAVWIDPVVLRAITISWNNIGIPVRSWPYYGHHDKPHPWFTNDFGLPRMGCGTKRPQVTQHQGRSESERGHYPHTSASLPQSQINEHLVMIVPTAQG